MKMTSDLTAEIALSVETASAISLGKRHLQEDALITDFQIGAEFGLAVLADGMGGHAAGDVASKIVVTEVFSELKLQSGNTARFMANAPEILAEAADSANECLLAHSQANAETRGMGATLLATVIANNKLHWISVGDSPLYLFRDGRLRQLNEDHSLAPQIELMIMTGQMSEEEGRNHPDRACLTSVMCGGDIARIDCPREPMDLMDGDVLIVSSDGLQFLTSDEIEDILEANIHRGSDAIARALLMAVEDLDDPNQDNVSFTVIKTYAQADHDEKHVVLRNDRDGGITTMGLDHGTILNLRVLMSRLLDPLRPATMNRHRT